MRFSCDWLSQYVELPEDVEELARRLTAAGHNVEGIERRDGDTLLEVEITTNRTDCMNHLGLARELAVLYDRPLHWHYPQPEEAEEETRAAARIELDEPHCLEYVARVVRGVRVGPSPEWLVRRLEAVGVRPINNVVDITNFVLWETGQPIHAFDLAKLRGPAISVRHALPGETLVTLDGENRELDPEVLLIVDAERPVALAGIMGGLETEVTGETSDVLIESAHFDRTTVRRGARALGLHTDASHRFERGADPSACLPAANRVAQLLAEIAGGRVLQGALTNPRPELFGNFTGTLDRARLNAFAGVDIPAADLRRTFLGLGFQPQDLGGDRLRLTVPPWRYYDFWQRRPDGEVYEADFFEEAMRIFGFENVPSALPPLAGPDPGSSSGHLLRERLREHLAAAGFTEAITFSFTDRGSLDRFAAPDGGRPVELANPLSEQYVVMRRSVLSTLIESVRYNQRRGAEGVRLFEIGHVFPGVEAAEIETLALAAGGVSGTPWDRRSSFDLFDLKGVVESLAEIFGLDLESRPAHLVGLIAGTSSELVVAGGETLGYLGQVDDPQLTFPIVVAELATSVLAGAERSIAVRPPSRFPGVAADLTLTHGVEVPWAEIAGAIRGAGIPDLREFGLKDRYRGEGVPEGAVNTTIHFLYNAEDRSLTQEQVNERHLALTEELRRRFGWKGGA